ncbi:ATP-binding protein [Marivirga harenae]|uniref:ATP-binding protein n=1 Tax=Marivirga harenae TaxID=2010992 RepID=UPI0026E0C99C|nr:ATP-binding protein [Marivirga harenae]WKV11448.1 ATP-binding protein [Marivirga harenae]
MINRNTDAIKASPTKDLFITMLVRDLTLRDAIGDLVDNSVDGAKSMRTEVLTESKTLEPSLVYKGLEIFIVANKNEFSIKDNCGGIDVATAREYAFRFGRAKGKPNSPHSVGQFGIGMKRALFKLGDSFSVKSKAETSQFEMNVNVPEWQRNEGNWDFEFSSKKENIFIEENERGTEIVVKNLNSDVQEQFEDPLFMGKLREEIELEHLYNLNRGLVIKINGFKLKNRSLDLIEHDKFKSAKWEKSYEDGMNVTIISGISKDSSKDGGWYIFCNERLIVGPEQTELTGWTGRGGDGGPHYHSQYNRFRGYVFFEAENSAILPWNTTKNGMDRDSPRFKQVRRKMIEQLKVVTAFLSIVKAEREQDNKDRPYEEMLNSASIVSISKYKETNYETKFTFPKIEVNKPKKINESKISYSVLTSYLKDVKKELGVSKANEVGELTFKYFYESEIGDYNE